LETTKNLLIISAFGCSRPNAYSSTIVTSQLPVANWYDVFGEGTIADAVLDRLVHTSYRIEFIGENLRKKL